jgi:hypothetical protein
MHTFGGAGPIADAVVLIIRRDHRLRIVSSDAPQIGKLPDMRHNHAIEVMRVPNRTIR